MNKNKLIELACSVGAIPNTIVHGRNDSICFTPSELQEFVDLLFDGKVLVPTEPTQLMLDAELGLRPWDNLPSYEQRRDLRPVIWKAMLRAVKLGDK
jgi:hypothetical protein